MKLISVKDHDSLYNQSYRDEGDHSSPDLFCLKMLQNGTLNSQEASEKQRQKDLSGRRSTWQPALMFPALMKEKTRCG